MNNSERTTLVGKDFVAIGIYSALIFVIFVVVSLPFMPFMAFTYPFIGGVCAFFTAPVFMLMTYKVAKRGTILISVTVFVLVYALMGYVYLLPYGIITGVVCEAVMWKKGAYRNFWHNMGGYTVFSILMYIGSTYVPIYILGKGYYMTMQSQNTEAAALHIQFAFSPMWVAIAVGTAVFMSVAGCFIGRRILKKHFVKAGLIQENEQIQ